MPTTTPGDAASQAAQVGDELESILRNIGPAEETAAPVAVPEPAATPSEEKPEPEPVPSMESRLKELDLLLDTAVDSGNESEVRSLIQRGKDLIRAEKAAREKSLVAAEDAFDAALRQYGESDEQTVAASREVESWKVSLRGYDDFITQQDAYFDDILANMRLPESPAPTTEPGPVTAPAGEQTPMTQLEKLRAAKQRLDALREQIIALAKEVDIAAAKAEAGIPQT
jgi:hypothetical protein